MRKLVALIALMSTFFVTGIGFTNGQSSHAVMMQDAVQNVLVTSGTIKEIKGQQVTIIGEGAFTEVVLNVGEDTYVVGGENGEKVNFAKLKKGDAITSYYGSALTRSIPPQGRAIALITGAHEDAAMYMKVKTVEKIANGGVRVLCTNSDRLITINPEILAGAVEIQEGSELLVWYKAMTLSMPGQATATKAVLLMPAADLRVSLQAGVLVAAGQELALSSKDQIIEKNGTVFLPLRVVAEKFGYQISWNQETQSIELVNGARTATLAVGSIDYGKSRMRVKLGNAPMLVNGTTLVPVEFFSEILDLRVNVSNQHV